jgi:hypothetical protein
MSAFFDLVQFFQCGISAEINQYLLNIDGKRHDSTDYAAERILPNNNNIFSVPEPDPDP